MAKKKLLHLVTRLEKGGTLSNILSLLEGLSLDYEIVLALGVINSEKDIVNASAAKAGYRVVWLPDLVRDISPVKDLLSFLDLLDLFIHETPFALHTHTSKAGFLGRLAAGFLRFKRVIHTPHGHVFYGYFGPLKTAIIVLMEKLAASFTKVFIVFSIAEREDNLKRKIGKSEQYRVIPNGIIEAPYEAVIDIPEKKMELGLPGDKKIIGYAGRFAPVKGVDLFIEALNILSKKRTDFTGVIAGAGTKEEEAKVKALAREPERQGLIRFLGFRQDLPEVLKTFDVFVLPSRNEGFGLSAVEAQFAGVPVVASSVGGLSEIIVAGETGILVKPVTAAGFASSIDILLSDPALALKLKDNARTKVYAEYGYKTMLASVKGLYERF